MATKSPASFDQTHASVVRSRARGGFCNRTVLLRISGETLTYDQAQKRAGMLDMDDARFRRRVSAARKKGPLTWENLK